MYRPNYVYNEPYPYVGPLQNCYGPPQQQPLYMTQQPMQQGCSDGIRWNPLLPSYQSRFAGHMSKPPMGQMGTPIRDQTYPYSQPAMMSSMPQQQSYITQHSQPQQAFYGTPSRNTMVPECMNPSSINNMGNYNQMGASQAVRQQRKMPASNQQQKNDVLKQQKMHSERITLRTTTYKYSKTVLIKRGSLKRDES